MLKKIVLGLCILVSMSGCLKNENNSTCTYDECSVKAPASEIQAVKDYLAANNITNAQEHCSGLFYIIDDSGTGRSPNPCNYVNVTYQGKFTNGNTFDEGTVDLGLNSVIRGWTNGVPLIKEGGKIHLFIPPSLGYGSQPYQTIPGNSILIFEVTLNGIY